MKKIFILAILFCAVSGKSDSLNIYPFNNFITGSNVIVELRTETGGIFQMQISTDLKTWQNSGPPITIKSNSFYPWGFGNTGAVGGAFFRVIRL